MAELERLSAQSPARWGATAAEAPFVAMRAALFGSLQPGDAGDAGISPARRGELQRDATAAAQIFERGCGAAELGLAGAAAPPASAGVGPVHSLVIALCPRLVTVVVEGLALSGGRTAAHSRLSALLLQVYCAVVKANVLPPPEDLPLPPLRQAGGAATLTHSMLMEQAGSSAAAALPLFDCVTGGNISVLASAVISAVALWLHASRAELFRAAAFVLPDIVAMLQSPSLSSNLTKRGPACLPVVSVIHTITSALDCCDATPPALAGFADACLHWYTTLLLRGNAKALRVLHVVMGASDNDEGEGGAAAAAAAAASPVGSPRRLLAAASRGQRSPVQS